MGNKIKCKVCDFETDENLGEWADLTNKRDVRASFRSVFICDTCLHDIIEGEEE